MRATSIAAWALLAFGSVLLSVAPAVAAGRSDQVQHRPAASAAAGTQRLAANAPQRTAPAPRATAGQASRAMASQAVRGPRAMRVQGRGAAHASALPRMIGSARAEAVAPMRGRLAVTRDRHAAVSNAQACRSGASRRGSCASGPAMSWTRGLEPAAGVQASECPDGTMATLASGHDNITRCMPI